MSAATTPVFLVGFMGTGKSTTGQILARLMGWDFIDLDDQIVAAEGRSIPRIFAEAGEVYFRRREADLLASLRGRSCLVVACGGGTYAREAGRRQIDRIGRAVWLQLPLETALDRCRDGTVRPLLRDRAEAEALYRLRLPSYRAAPLHVDLEGLSPEAAAERIAALLQ